MKRVFNFKKGEIIDGTEDIHYIIHDMLDKNGDSRCDDNFKITIVRENGK
jgi:hypothetical protein